MLTPDPTATGTSKGPALVEEYVLSDRSEEGGREAICQSTRGLLLLLSKASGKLINRATVVLLSAKQLMLVSIDPDNEARRVFCKSAKKKGNLPKRDLQLGAVPQDTG